MNALKNNPVAIASVVPIIVYLAAAFGFDVDEETAAGIAGFVLLAGGAVARQLVRTKRTLPNPDAVKIPDAGPERLLRPGEGV
jgi:uncharacterized protein (DUF697 family)